MTRIYIVRRTQLETSLIDRITGANRQEEGGESG